MKLSELTLTPDNHFVAMEYYWLMLNRTLLVLIMDDDLIGIKVRGPIAAPTADPLTELVLNVSSLALDGDGQDPYAFINARHLNRVKDIDLQSDDLLNVSSANFRISRNDIVQVYYDRTRKWGMGPVPHDGKVYVKLHDNSKREFIILGNQSGQHIADVLNSARKR